MKVGNPLIRCHNFTQEVAVSPTGDNYVCTLFYSMTANRKVVQIFWVGGEVKHRGYVDSFAATCLATLKCTLITLSNNTNVAFITLLLYFLHSKYVNKRFIIKGLWFDVYLKGHGSYL